jgi:uncharacterized repeat protein (TIGR03803 family)
MGNRQILHSIRTVFVVVLLTTAAFASSAKVIYSFSGGPDGQYPDTDLVMDKAGNIYGTAVQGGNHNIGAVWELSPSQGGWTETTLYSFTGGRDGGQPYKGVTLGPDGSIYGTAVVGGKGGACEDGCGVVYRLTNSGGKWKQSVIHNFTGPDGQGPGAGVTFDKKGNLYGMTPTGGPNGFGVIYRLKPRPDGTWKFTIIHAFTGGNDGVTGSAGRMILDKAGNLYGTATVGGKHGDGTVFKLKHTPTGWTLKTLYAFKGEPDGAFPYSGVIFDKAGNLYGVTYYDGEHEVGAVYQLSPQPGGGWKERVLHSFGDGPDGGSSTATLVFDNAGNLYGTTSEGGDAECNCGTIFKLTPGDNGTWTESTEYRFTGNPDAGVAYNGMVKDAAGNLYGVTVHGGNHNAGAVFQFVP